MYETKPIQKAPISSADESSNRPPRAELIPVLRKPVCITASIASRKMSLQELLHVVPGSIIHFPQPADSPLDIHVNNRKIAAARAVTIDDHFGFQVTQVEAPDRLIPAFGPRT